MQWRFACRHLFIIRWWRMHGVYVLMLRNRVTLWLMSRYIFFRQSFRIYIVSLTGRVSYLILQSPTYLIFYLIGGRMERDWARPASGRFRVSIWRYIHFCEVEQAFDFSLKSANPDDEQMLVYRIIKLYANEVLTFVCLPPDSMERTQQSQEKVEIISR